MIRELEECERVFWLQFQWVINLVLSLGLDLVKLCGPSACLTTHTHSRTPVTAHAALKNACMQTIYILACIVQYSLTCVHAFTRHVKFWLKMSTWFSLNRRCQGMCCPAQNRAHQLHSTFIPTITFWHVLRYLCCPVRQRVWRGFCQQRAS